MTLSVLLYALMSAMLVLLSSVLVVDAVRALSRRNVRTAARSEERAERSADAGARARRVAPTRS